MGSCWHQLLVCSNGAICARVWLWLADAGVVNRGGNKMCKLSHRVCVGLLRSTQFSSFLVQVPTSSMPATTNMTTTSVPNTMGAPVLSTCTPATSMPATCMPISKASVCLQS